MAIKFGYTVADPGEAGQVERSGFDSVWVVDHFFPFSHQIGLMAPHIVTMSLAVLPVVLSRTNNIPAGVSVICPCFSRYHSAVIAQYFAQLDYMFPGRVILGVGTGEAKNEVPIIGHWSPYRERRDRLVEAVDIIRRLWNSNDFFDYEGRFFQLRNGYLYLKPKGNIPILISAARP